MAAAEPPRLKARYVSEIRPALLRRFGYVSTMQAPRIDKITLNMGVGDGKQDSMAVAKGGNDATPTFAARASQSPTSSSARACRSASPSRCGASAATNSSTA